MSPPNLAIVLTAVILAAAAACSPFSGDKVAGPLPEPSELDLNDVSILLPPVRAPEDPVIKVDDLRVNGGPVWTDEAFGQFLEIASSEAGAVAVEDTPNHDLLARVDIGAIDEKTDWYVAGIRIDPGAPGLSPAIVEAFGQSPEIRLIVQPAPRGGVLDVAAQLIFRYDRGAEPAPGCPLPRVIPDDQAFQAIADDLLSLKRRLAAGEIGDLPVATEGRLGIHPAAHPDKASMAMRTAFLDALKTFLEAHLDPSKLNAMTVMGLPRRAPEPWIFMAMTRDAVHDAFEPLPSPALKQDDRLRFSQMLDVRPGTEPRNPHIWPVSAPNNLNPITCAFEVPPGGEAASPADPVGVSTVELFPEGDASRMREIVRVIADPGQAHFYNTDCLSCHTETQREMDILGTDGVDAPVEPEVLPKELWNLRNFGWRERSMVHPELGLRATASRRTARETEAVVRAINARYLRP